MNWSLQRGQELLLAVFQSLWILRPYDPDTGAPFEVELEGGSIVWQFDFHALTGYDMRACLAFAGVAQLAGVGDDDLPATFFEEIYRGFYLRPHAPRRELA